MKQFSTTLKEERDTPKYCPFLGSLVELLIIENIYMFLYVPYLVIVVIISVFIRKKKLKEPVILSFVIFFH